MSKGKKKPVLTSPWKIGMLVAMLLLVVSFGVGYYLVDMYNVDLTWLNAEMGKWGVDSYTFFKEIYPMVAGVILISLLSYFIIASAVRRYKYYLDSGQDYREIIRVAESIDDLTNPTQVARLSEYPELQSILRNYGDQIREISEEMEKKGEETKSVDLELEIDSLLEGKVKNFVPHEGRWWSPLYNKIQNYVRETSELNQDLKKKGGINREIIGRVSLSQGKAVESVGKISERLIGIIDSVDELFRRVKQVQQEQAGGEENASGQQAASPGEVELSLKKLDKCNRAIIKLSDENNNLALNIALMAARGEMEEDKLAKLAEKIRISAERHKGISKAITAINHSLMNKWGSAAGDSTAGVSTGVVPEALNSIISVSREIGSSARELQKLMGEAGEELHDSNKLLRDGLKDINTADKEEKTDEAVRDESSVSLESIAGEEGDGSGDLEIVGHQISKEESNPELVIDHGSKDWGKDGELDQAGELEPDAPPASPEVDGEMDEMNLGEVDQQESRIEPAESGDTMDKQAPSETGKQGEESPSGRRGESWMEMPGHRWVSIDVEKEKQEVDQVDVEVDGGPAGITGDPAGHRNGQQERASGEMQSLQEDPVNTDGFMDMKMGEGDSAIQEDRGEQENVSSREGSEERIYDLYELGAVEYREESKI